MVVGVDLGAKTVYAVAVEGLRRRDRPVVADAVAADAETELGEIVAFCRLANRVAIDAPEAYSIMQHLEDLRLAPKFRRYRCCEIAVGQARLGFPPFGSPAAGESVPGWIAVGFRLWEALREEHHLVLEVFPNAGFRHLAAGRPLRPKTTRIGLEDRWRYLAEFDGLEIPVGHAMWGHDGIDAFLAALVAVHHAQGRAWRRSAEPRETTTSARSGSRNLPKRREARICPQALGQGKCKVELGRAGQRGPRATVSEADPSLSSQTRPSGLPSRT